MTKERLKAYKDIKKERDDLKQRVQKLNAQLYKMRAQRLDGMPRGGSGENYVTEELIDTKAKLLEMLTEKLVELDTECIAVESAIKKLKPRERLLVRLHYFDGRTWEQVCVDMTYSWSQVHRIHAKALKKLKEEEAKP